MREIVFDTETTGFEPGEGHRIVEIGCVELENHMPTGKTYQAYMNPERDMPTEAVMVHGLTEEFLGKQPLFAEIVDHIVSSVSRVIRLARSGDSR